MILSLRHLIVIGALGSRSALLLENLALRQQLLALHAKCPGHRLSVRHKLFWIFLQRLWSGWKAPLVLVTPRTVVERHRAGFRLYWKLLSRARVRRSIDFWLEARLLALRDKQVVHHG